MAPNWHCILCKADQDVDIDTHISERHSEPDKKQRMVDGKLVEITDEQYVRDNTEGGVDDSAVVTETAKRTAIPILDIFESLGVKEEDIESVQTEVVAGATSTDFETKLVMEAMDEYCNFKVDRLHFIISFLEWGFLSGFTENLAKAGGFFIRESITSGNSKIFAQCADMLPEIADKLKDVGLGRDFTFRRLGRHFAPKIPTLVAKNKSLARYSITGTPISNRLGIDPSLFLTCTSIFEFIKPLKKWSKDEHQAWVAHNTAVDKEDRGGQLEYQPQDLRIDPEMSRKLRQEGESDFTKRYKGRFADNNDYEKASKGQQMYDQMLAQSNARFGMGTAGLGAPSPHI